MSIHRAAPVVKLLTTSALHAPRLCGLLRLVCAPRWYVCRCPQLPDWHFQQLARRRLAAGVTILRFSTIVGHSGV
eukprot:6184947-Pleurochrysis_carterae.AAC.1